MANIQSQPGYAGFGQYFRGLREDVGYSLGRLSSLTGIERTHLGKLEEGLVEPRDADLRNLAGVFSYNKSFDPVKFYLHAGRLPPPLRASESLVEVVRGYHSLILGYDRSSGIETKDPFGNRVGQILLEGGFINPEQLEKARVASEESGDGLLDTLIKQKMLAQETLVTLISFQLRIPVVDLRHVEVDPLAAGLLPKEYARKYNVMPTGFDVDGSLRIATRMPTDYQLSADLSSLTGRPIKFILAIGGKLEDLINRHYEPLLPLKEAESLPP